MIPCMLRIDALVAEVEEQEELARDTAAGLMRPAYRPRFDRRGQRLGHSNWERAWCTRSKLPIEP